MKKINRNFLYAGIVLLVLTTIGLFGYNYYKLDKEKIYGYSPEGTLELQRGYYIATSGVEWTARDELNYAIKLSEFKKSGGELG